MLILTDVDECVDGSAFVANLLKCEFFVG